MSVNNSRKRSAPRRLPIEGTTGDRTCKQPSVALGSMNTSAMFGRLPSFSFHITVTIRSWIFPHDRCTMVSEAGLRCPKVNKKNGRGRAGLLLSRCDEKVVGAVALSAAPTVGFNILLKKNRA
ncbi:hypothetical protein EVAR_44679_1 [Eumeta japonica]|uniref:Uncharacterized protein n=1 Tax=Eumeta variegata TaxID=151549 RepID=A0A4C1Y5G3_EUMVA|nr:hypothetical protein EVAR_44679_1 [Eumeta japonica]